jgi:hypothetical protein
VADYLVQQDGSSRFILEDASGDLLTEAQPVAVEPSFIASATVVYAPTLVYTGFQTVLGSAGTFTWVCPPGVTSILVGAYGAGGAGGNATIQQGGGGGGGAFAERAAVPVTPGTSYTIVVGAPGSTGGANGAASSFVGDSGVQVVAAGGSGGTSGSGGGGGGGGGQAASSTGDGGLVFSGGNGGTGGGVAGASGGGGASGNHLATGANGASGALGGAGGTGANGGGSGGDGASNGTGSAPGGGGSGGGGTNVPGNSGAPGQVTITAFAVSFITSVTVVYPPALVGQQAVPFIASVTAVYAPTLVHGANEVDVPFISSKTRVYRLFSLFNPDLTFGGPGNGGESFLIRLAPNGTSETATLTTPLAATGNILNVTGDGGFPTDKPFMVTIDAEVMLVFQIAPGNYHVRLRAASNTSASSHTAGTSVVWGDSYDMAITAGFAIANSFTADINSTGTFTYPGWLICFDSSQGYNAAGDRYPMHVAQMLGVFDAGAGSSGTSRCDGAQPSAIHTANGVSDDCPAALTNPARIATDINVGDVAVLRYTNPEAYVIDLGGRSTSLESWFGLKRVDLADHDVTFTDPNGIVIDTTGTYDTFTGSVNGEWANPVPLVTGIAPDASDTAGFPIPTPNPVAWTTVTMPASSRHFTRTAIGEKGWPMCCLAVRQGNRRVPYWQSWDWHNYAYVYDGFGTDCTYCQILINRNGIIFGSVPVVNFPNDDDVDGPDAVWDDGTYDFGASWFVALFNTPYIVAGPGIGGSAVVIGGGAGGPVPTVGFGGGPTPGGPVVVTPPNVEGGAGGGIEQPPIGLHVWQKSGGF